MKMKWGDYSVLMDQDGAEHKLQQLLYANDAVLLAEPVD